MYSKQQCKCYRDRLRNNRAVSFQRSRKTDQPIVQNSSGFREMIRRQAIVVFNCCFKILCKDTYAKYVAKYVAPYFPHLKTHSTIIFKHLQLFSYAYLNTQNFHLIFYRAQYISSNV